MSTEAQEMNPEPQIDPMVNPYPSWKVQRSDRPVQRVEEIEDPFYIVLTWELAEQVLRDPGTFSSRGTADTMEPLMGPMIVGMDGDEHRHYRNIVAYAFRPSAMERWEDELIHPVIQGLLDEIAPKGEAELVEEFTSRFPVRIIAGMIGAEDADYEQIHRWAQAITSGPDHPEAFTAAQALREYLEPIVEDRKQNPRDDLVSDIVTAEVDGKGLDDDHIIGLLRLLFPAGAETTHHASGSMFTALLRRPDILERVRDDRDLVAPLVEESLRWETAVTIVMRKTTREVDLGGVALPEGAYVLISTGAANRDPSHFDHPGEWDPDRELEPHLSFGTGRHQCLGMHLARTEMRVALDAVIDRLPNLRLDPEHPEPSVVGFAFRGPDALPVLFDPA